MKSTSFLSKTAAVAALLGLMAAGSVRASNLIYGISTPGSQFFFQVTNIPNNFVYPPAPSGGPELILTAGATYRFFIQTSPFFHPVVISTNNAVFPPINGAYNGASPQNVDSVPITITIPATNFPSLLYYVCGVHNFSGRINILPAPPANQILSTKVTTNIVLVSTGTTNTWVLTPEFSSNLLSGAWSAVPNFTNSFASLTNTTTFGRLDAICGSNVFLRLRQSPPTP